MKRDVDKNRAPLLEKQDGERPGAQKEKGATGPYKLHGV